MPVSLGFHDHRCVLGGGEIVAGPQIGALLELEEGAQRLRCRRDAVSAAHAGLPLGDIRPRDDKAAPNRVRN